MSRGTLLIAASAGLAALVLVAAWRSGRLFHAAHSSAGGSGRPTAAAPAAGVAADRRALPVPMLKQWDPRWGADNLGNTREPLGAAGCTVSCAAMSFTHLGVPTTPKQLNDWLTANGGFTPGGLLVWSKCVEFTGGRVSLDYFGEPDCARIDRALAAGRPAIVRVELSGGVQHWVLVVGTEGGEYLINDPLSLDPGATRLSTCGGRIYALRIFRKR
jgi:hypothetical protein